MYRLFFFEATSLFSAFSENLLAFSQIFEFQNPLSDSKNAEKSRNCAKIETDEAQRRRFRYWSGSGWIFFSTFRVFIFQTSQDKDDAVAARGQQTGNQGAAKKFDFCRSELEISASGFIAHHLLFFAIGYLFLSLILSSDISYLFCLRISESVVDDKDFFSKTTMTFRSWTSTRS